jgi:hypothetical protein
MPAILTGNYTRPDDLRAFEYEVTLERGADGRLQWVATVASEGAFRGRTSGTIADGEGMDGDALQLAVRELVETSIRERISSS